MMSNTIFSKCIGINNYNKTVVLENGLEAIYGQYFGLLRIKRANASFPGGWKFVVKGPALYKCYGARDERLIYCGHAAMSNLKICKKYVIIQTNEREIVTKIYEKDKEIIEWILEQ